MRSRSDAPYHHYGPGLWGIYFVENTFIGLLDIAREQLRREHAHRLDCAWVAWALTRAFSAHEFCHFRVEFGGTLTELVTDAPELYRSYLHRGWAGRSLDEPALTEEALATAYEIRAARRIDEDLAATLKNLSSGLPGYGNFAKCLDRSGEQAALATLLTDLSGSTPSGELLRPAIAREYQASVPRRWLAPSKRLPSSAQLLPRILALPLDKVLKDARRRKATIQPGGRHPYMVKTANGKVPLKKWDDRRVPQFVVKQLAGLFGLPPAKYCEQVLRGAPA